MNLPNKNGIVNAYKNNPVKVISAFVFILMVLLPLLSGVFSSPKATVNNKSNAEMHKLFKDYILSNPEIIEEAMILLQEKRRNQQNQQIDDIIETNLQIIENPQSMYIGGNPKGDVVLIEFFDYNCGYCKRSFSDMQALKATDPNLKVVMYEFPILGPSSQTAARASLAALKQNKYWDLHVALISENSKLTDELIFEIANSVGLDMQKLEEDMDSEEVEYALATSYQLAKALGIDGTPAFIINGKLHHGAVDIKTLVAKAHKN